MLTIWITIISYFDSSSDDGGYTEYKVEIKKESEDKDMRRCMIHQFYFFNLRVFIKE